ncbi:MAG TPA: ABC transporter permease [Acidimicrobiales bacterium]
MLHLTWHSLRASRRRLAGTAIAVVLGVAFLVGTLVLGDTIAANFDDLFTDTAAGTDVVVRGESPLESSLEADPGRRPVDAGLVERLASVDGVDVAEAQVVGYGQLLGADGDPIGGNGPPRQAGNWITTPELNPYELAEGRAPRADDEVVINRGAAEDGDLSVGDRTTVQLPEPVEVTVVGIATFGGADGLGETTMTAFTLDAARELVMRDPSTVTSILVRAEDGVDAGELRSRLADTLPGGLEAITGDDLVEERLDSLDFLGIVRGALVAFALVGMLAAGLSIHNAFSITVVQRTRELALLRTIGASRRQVRRLIRLEGLAIGSVAALVGVVAGVGVAAVLRAAFAGAGFALPASGLTVDRSAVVVGLVVGIVATLLATRGPARRAARLAPIEALRASEGEAGTVPGARRLAAAALVGAGAAVAVGAGDAVPLVALGALALVVGTLLAAPAAVPAFARLLGAALRRPWGLTGDLAVENARREPRRTARTATALVVGIAVTAMLTVVASSASAMVEADVSDGFGDADLSIASPVFGGGVLAAAALDDVAQVPEVDRAVGVARGTVVVGGEETQVAATDPALASEVLDVEVRDGSLAGVGPDELVVGASRADDEGWRVGSPVEITYLDGVTERATVAAVIEDVAVLSGIVVPTPAWFDHAAQPAYANVFMTLRDGVSLEQGRDAVGGIAQRYSGDVQDRDEFAEAAAAGLDMLLALVYALLTLAIVISLLGIANALSMAVHERRREIGLLRAVGQTRRQARSVLRLESVIVAAFGTAVGVALGALAGAALFRAIADEGGPVLPWPNLLAILAAGVVVGVVAAWRPARRAARLDVLEAIATA